MSAPESLVKELVPQDIPLENIYLDPNNPRFVGSDWTYISDSEIPHEAIQEKSRIKLVDGFGIDKLRMNMEINGFLPIDRVVVREFDSDKFVVLEGNRRICAAKMISSYTSEGTEISDDVIRSLESIPALVYTGTDRDAAWILQGLRHITGINEWSAFNKAKLLVEQMEENELTLTEVGQRFGLTAHGAGQWMRGYYAFKQARERSDYIREVDEKLYPYLQELFSRSSVYVREWLQWSETEKEFKNDINFNEFLGWLYPRPEPEVDQVESDSQGDWSRRALRTRDDIRRIAELIDEFPDEFLSFRGDGQLDKAYSRAMSKKYEEEAKDKYDPVADIFFSIKDCAKDLDNVPLRVFRNPEQAQALRQALKPLLAAIKAIEESLPDEEPEATLP